MNRIISRYLAVLLPAFVALLVFSSSMVLADGFFDSENEPNMAKPRLLPDHQGLTRMGPRGLISIPTPEITGEKRLIAGYKQFSRQNSSYQLQNVEYHQQIEESVGQLVVPITDDAELVFTRWVRERTTTPDRLGLSHKDEILSFGGKVSGTIEERADFCLGIQWAGENDAALANSDLETLAQLRAVYATTGSEMAPNLYGYAHLRQCYIPEFHIILNDNSEIIRKSELFGQVALAFERRFEKKQDINAILEIVYTDYPDFYFLDKSRWQTNLGLRGQIAGLNLELTCLSATFEPQFSAGISAGF